MDLWQMKPVQVGLKTFALGTIFAIGMYGFGRVAENIKGPKDANWLSLRQKYDEESVDYIWAHDPAWIDLLARLEMFSRFDVEAYNVLVESVRKSIYLSQTSPHEKTAAQSFRTRANLQKVIEALRLFRAVVEIKIPIEDFDEIAVDVNAYVEQLCADAIQNTYS